MLKMRHALGLAALSATLVSLSFVPYNLYPLGFVGLIPLFFLFEDFHATKKQIVLLWAVWIIILNLVGYHWIMHTIAVYGMMPAAVAFPLFLLYTLGTGGKMLLFFFFLRWMYRSNVVGKSKLARTLAVTAAFGLCEIVGWQLFPWYGANIVSGNLLFAQAADLIGTRGLSLLWAALQYLLYISITDYYASAPRLILHHVKTNRALQSFVGIFVLVHAYGYIEWQRFAAAEMAAPKIVVGVPQGNAPLIALHHERPYIISRMVAQTQRLVADAANAGQKIDLVVWPESSIPALEFERNQPLKTAILDLQKSTLTPIIINDIYADLKARKDYSNMWHLDLMGVPLNNYQKNFLLPFGEFMPLGDTFPSLKSLFPAVSDFAHGEKFTLFNISSKVGIVKAMPLICYEVILPDYARAFDAATAREAQFIINITNDAWFGDSVESLQHMTLGAMRAIELRVPILRSTNSGISAFVSSTGEIFGKTKLFERVNQIYKVPVMERARTVFSFVGNWPQYLFIAFAVFYLWIAYQKSRRVQ